MSDIKKARELVSAARAKLEETHPEIADLLARAETMMWRERPVKKPADPESPPVNAEMAAEIRAFARANEKMSLRKIGDHFGGVNQGRISEALHWKK